MNPSFSSPDRRGRLWLPANDGAGTCGGQRAGREPVHLARIDGCGELGRTVRIYQTSFAPATVHMQACHAHAVMREPAKALAAARKIGTGELNGISYGRHLLDVAQAHADARHLTAATTVLAQARSLAPVWFRHQGIARTLVDDIYEQQKRISPALRDLGAAVNSNWYAPYYRRQK